MVGLDEGVERRADDGLRHLLAVDQRLVRPLLFGNVAKNADGSAQIAKVAQRPGVGDDVDAGTGARTSTTSSKSSTLSPRSARASGESGIGSGVTPSARKQANFRIPVKLWNPRSTSSRRRAAALATTTTACSSATMTASRMLSMVFLQQILFGAELGRQSGECCGKGRHFLAAIGGHRDQLAAREILDGLGHLAQRPRQRSRDDGSESRREQNRERNGHKRCTLNAGKTMIEQAQHADGRQDQQHHRRCKAGPQAH